MLAFSLIAIAGGRIGAAENTDDLLLRMERRLEAIEQENNALRQELLELRLPPRPSEQPPASDEKPVFSDSPEDQRLRSLILDTYHELDDQRRQEEAALKKADDEQAIRDRVFKVMWKDGFLFETKDKAFRLHLGGRTQFDSAWFGVPQDIQNDPRIINRWGDGADFRRARIKLDGTMYDFIEWAVQYDFVNSVRDGVNDKTVVAPTDLWWQFTKLPVVGNWRTGNVKEPIGFEHLVSSRFLPFMERSFNQDSFYGGFNNGFTPGSMFFNTACDERMTWSVGVFKPTRNVFAASTVNGDYSFTGRITYLPYYENEGEELLHVGFSARQASTFDGTMQFRTRGPERSGLSQQWPRPADTGSFFGNSMQWLNAELVGVHGPWTFQTEYLASWVDDGVKTIGGTPVNTVFYQGGYAQVLYYLTGEHDHYSRKTGVFERVVPGVNSRLTGPGQPSSCYPWGWLSCGAWQVGLRYNYLDLNDNGINGGVLQDVTAGLNWFLNPNMKIQWNYSATHRATASHVGEGFIHGFGIRLAHDF